MSLTVTPVVQWITASPLWGEYTAKPAQMQQPALLRFATDAFMEKLAEVVQSKQPATLVDYIAQKESYQARPVGAPAAWQPPLTQLKLYQPVHGHFNLVAASLVCRIPGLPDRVVDTANDEKASFVLRRLAANGDEMAWIADPLHKGWRPLTADALGNFPFVEPDEELLPLFPINFSENGRPRRMLVGFIPTESRDSYLAQNGASPLIPDSAALAQETEPRLAEVETRVINPLKALRKQTDAAELPDHLTQDEIDDIVLMQETGQQDASRFLLLDLAEFLSIHTKTVWDALVAKNPPSLPEESALYATLKNASVDTLASNAPSWLAALPTALAEWDRINGESATAPSQNFNLKNTDLNPDTLRANLAALLLKVPAPPVPPPLAGTGRVDPREVPKLDGNPNTLYVLRCVYQRPACGPLQDDVVSRATEKFALASFFDFDAPSRPIRIALPVDTSIKGLRKFNKNVGILISNQLRRQMSSITDLKEALDGNLASGEPFNLGVICSFSIPTITICALIVLMIFIFLLNIVFWWLPFFRICFPINLKAE